MNGLSIGVIAGTSDATEWIQMLPAPYCVTAFVATVYGQTILQKTGCTVHMGRLNEDGFSQALCGMDAVVDASHPFAVKVTATVQKVCRTLHIPYFRIIREKVSYDYDRIHWVASKEEAAQLLTHMEGNILWTTGSNTLAFYESMIPSFAKRSWVRILDTEDSRKQTAHSKVHRIYAMPPFSIEDTVSCIQAHKIRILVSKDSGLRGGVVEKIQAAQQCGIDVVLIAAPKEIGMTAEQILAALTQMEKEKRA